MLKAAVYLRTHAFRVGQTLREHRERGATATEYGLLVAFIAFLIIAGVGLFGNALNGWFGEMRTAIDGWNTNPGQANP